MKKINLALVLLSVILSGCLPGANLFEAVHDAVEANSAAERGREWRRQGLEYYQKGEIEKAELHFKDDLGTLCRTLHPETKQYVKAVKSCGDLYNQMNSGKYSSYYKHEVVGFLTDALEITGQHERAIEVMKQWLTKDNPSDGYGFERLARYYNQNQQYDEAITAATRAIELKTDYSAAYIQLGLAYRWKKKYDESYHAFKKAIELTPTSAFYYQQMGELFHDQEKYAEEVEAYDKAVSLELNSLNSIFRLAEANRRIGRYNDAITAVNKASKIQVLTGIGITTSIKDDYLLVKEIMRAGPAEKAGLEVGDKIIKVDGNSTEGWTKDTGNQNLMGTPGTQIVIMIARDGIDKPLEKHIIRQTSTVGDAGRFGLRGLIHRDKGNLEEAFKDAEKAYSLDPANYWAIISFGAAALDRGQYDEAIRLLAGVQNNPQTSLLNATALAKKGQTEEAVRVYLAIPEESLSQKDIPLMNDRQALLKVFKPAVKAQMERARSFEAKNMHKEMLLTLSEALQIADAADTQAIQADMFNLLQENPILAEEMPEEARKYALRGEVLAAEAEFSQALMEFKKAIRIAPHVAKLYYNSAHACAEIKKYQEAITFMKTYIKLAADAPNIREEKDKIIMWEFMLERGQ